MTRTRYITYKRTKRTHLAEAIPAGGHTVIINGAEFVAGASYDNETPTKLSARSASTVPTGRIERQQQSKQTGAAQDVAGA